MALAKQQFSRFSSVGMVSERVGHDLATERQVNHTFYEENYLSKKIIEKNSILVFFFFSSDLINVWFKGRHLNFHF